MRLAGLQRRFAVAVLLYLSCIMVISEPWEPFFCPLRPGQEEKCFLHQINIL